MRSNRVLRFRYCLACGGLLIAGLMVMSGCEKKKMVSREEIPLIKETLHAVEQTIIARDAAGLDSLLSPEAAGIGTTAQGVIDFIYADSTGDFTGFAPKEIVYRGDAARIDTYIAGTHGPTRPVTITLKKVNGIWLFKKIEPRIGEGVGDIVLPEDTTGQH